MRKQSVVILLILLTLLCGCGEPAGADAAPAKLPNSTEAPTAQQPAQPQTDETQPSVGAVSDRGQLMCPAQTQQDAEDIAELYGITLTEYDHGIALFYTEEDPAEVIRRGEESNWPALELNRISGPIK